MPISTKWKRRWKLLAAGAIFGLGLDTATPSSRLLMLLAILLMTVGAAWFLKTLLATRSEGILYRKRKEILLALSTASITLLLVVTISLIVRVGPRHFAVENQSYDAALGWAPPDLPDRAGQQGQTIDSSRDQIVMIGDSILYGHGVPGPETVSHRLEEILDTYQVLNLSVSGYSIDQYYIYLKRILPRVRAKLVIVGIFTGNDYEVTGLEYGWGHTKPLFRLRDGGLVLHNPDLLADNCIDHLAQSLLFRVLWAKKERALDLIHFFCSPVKLRPEELERVIGKLFASIDDEARARGASVLYVLLPQGQHLRAMEHDWRYFNKYNRLRQILDERGAQYYEFYPDIIRTVGEDEPDIFLDGAHYTPRGHKLLADSLARVIREKGLLIAEPASPLPSAHASSGER